MFQPVILYALFALLGLPLLTNAFHNVTYNDNDPAVVYSPSGAWMDWPPAGCLSWPGGQWTRNSTGQIALNFTGVAVYVYGLFDDDTNPIYTIMVDNEAPVRLGDVAMPSSQRCDPLFSKTGLAMKNHTVVFQMTDERPGDVKDLSFQGFIVTVPDEGDDVTTTGNSTSGQVNLSPHYMIIGGIGAVVVMIAAVVASIILYRRHRRRQKATAPVSWPAVSKPNHFLNSYQPMSSTTGVNDPNAPPPPVPFILPPSQEPTPQQNQPSTPWLAQNQSHSPWSSQVQHQASMQSPYPQQTQQQYQSGSPWSPAPSDGQSYPSPVSTPFSGQSYGTYPSNAPSSPAPPTESFTQYSYPPPSTAPPHMLSNEHSGTQNDMIVSRVAAQAMHQSYSTDTHETESKQLSYGQTSASSGFAAGAQNGHKYAKGGVDHNAAPVVRNENAEIEAAGCQSEAPPPGYMP